MRSRLDHPNFVYLLSGLLAVLCLNPILRDLFDYSSSFLSSLIFSSTLILGIWSLHESKRLFRFGIVLICASLAISLAVSFRPELAILRVFDIIILFTFCSVSFMFILAEITTDLNVDANRVVGAVCLYLLVGIMFGLFYMLIEAFLPGSFTNLYTNENIDDFSDKLFYYSFVTLTTLGYGDITPVRPIAKTVAFIEAIVGVFYMAILVGTLIGLFLNRARDTTAD